MKSKFIKKTDGYKLDHRRQYPDGTQRVLTNFTPRSTRVSGVDSIVHFGLQYFLQAYFMDDARDTFFQLSADEVCDDYQQMVDSYIGPNDIGTDHIRALHELGYLPIDVCSLPEGTRVPFRVPSFTYENTLDDFAWVTNYFETLTSCVVWQPCTSASTALRYRRVLENGAELTGGDKSFVDWQAHDFSFRGMVGPDGAALSGAAHLLSFTGTDCIPAIGLLQDYYQGEGLLGGSVPATEHSVMCAGGKHDELGTFNRLLNLYVKGTLSVVSDTWDLWQVIGVYLPVLKDKIMARDGKLVIRPDSGDPVLIMTGDQSADTHSLARIGVVEALWNIFGGTVNADGFKQLDSHIGTIYGDSITVERAQLIIERLKAKGFASTNVVFGIGSYTYQYVTRDTYGIAMKATWTRVKGVEHMLQKDPITDTSGKKSAIGRLAVLCDNKGSIVLVDNLSYDAWKNLCGVNQLKPVWRDGKFIRINTVYDMRRRIRAKEYIPWST